MRSPLERSARLVARETLGALRRLLPAGVPSLRIVYYHRIDDEDHRSCVTPRAFAEQMRWLRTEGFSVLRFDAIAEYLESGRPFPDRSVVITFDDGFADNHRNAFPVLASEGSPATIFLATGFIGGAALPVLRDRSGVAPLSWNQVEEMAQHGIEMGAHTVTHPELPGLDDTALRREVFDCRRAIEERLGRPVGSFCYPRGKFDERVVSAVRKAGYRLACTTLPGPVTADSPPLRLRRTFVARDDGVRDFAHKLAGTWDLLHAVRQRISDGAYAPANA